MRGREEPAAIVGVEGVEQPVLAHVARKSAPSVDQTEGSGERPVARRGAVGEPGARRRPRARHDYFGLVDAVFRCRRPRRPPVPSRCMLPFAVVGPDGRRPFWCMLPSVSSVSSVADRVAHVLVSLWAAAPWLAVAFDVLIVRSRNQSVVTVSEPTVAACRSAHFGGSPGSARERGRAPRKGMLGIGVEDGGQKPMGCSVRLRRATPLHGVGAGKRSKIAASSRWRPCGDDETDLDQLLRAQTASSRRDQVARETHRRGVGGVVVAERERRASGERERIVPPAPDR